MKFGGAIRLFALCLLLLTIINIHKVAAQSGTSSAIAGTVFDASGAAISGAEVTAVEVDTKATRSQQSDANGRFLFSQLNPGNYAVTVQARGFASQTSHPFVVGVGGTVALSFTLALSTEVQTVEVTAQQALLSLDNPNTSTTLEAKTIESLPNPGQDLTYLAQFAQGALMNTAGSSSDAKAPGGYGNVEFNGLPATSNGYILDGYDSNDPWLGLNIGLSTNLVIGLDAVPGSDRQHQLLLRRSGTVCRGPGELLHQVRHQRVSRRSSTRYGTARCSMRKTISFMPTTRRATSPRSRVPW